MDSLSHSDERKHFQQKPLQFIMARGRRRFLVRSSLVGTIILWIAVIGPFMIRGDFHGLGVVNVAFLVTVTLLVAFPFALAFAFYHWRKFREMASMDGLSVGDQNTTHGQNDGEKK